MAYQLICKDGEVVSYIGPSDIMPATLPAGAVVIPYAGELAALGRAGDDNRPVDDENRRVGDDNRRYAAPAVDLVAYATTAQAAMLRAGQAFNVAVSGQPAVSVLCDGTNDTRADLALLALFGQDNPAGTKTWLANDGVTTVLTGAQLVTLATLAGNWIAETYPVLVGVIGGIAGGTVTTTAQIDAAFAAVTA